MKQFKARYLTDLAKVIQNLAYSYPMPYACPTLTIVNTLDGYTVIVVNDDSK